MLKFIVLQRERGQRTKNATAEASTAKLILKFLIIKGKVLQKPSKDGFREIFREIFITKITVIEILGVGFH